MKIREVELVGFKSFVDKTRFLFDDRITGVVGPNGCGKSNIVDAIKWVMGELSAKSLRGDSMEDVIFNGAKTRKPLSMAQVSLIFSTEDGIVPAGFELYPQIEITRRLYRSGESEYLINKQPARLKDIHELLMDTGLGAKAYSIIEQGRISHIISSKPEDRRQLVEEAAGITKFRVKKEEALRKVERTLSDLDRVQDVVGEIKRQMNSLSRQAAKARRYKEMKDELREVDLELASREYLDLTRKQTDLDSDLKRVTEKKEKAQSSIETGENELAASQLTLTEYQAGVEDIRRALSKTNEEIRNSENARALLLRDIENEAAKAKTFEEEIIRFKGRIETLGETATTEDEQAKTLFASGEEKQKSLKELSEQLSKERQVLQIKQADAEQVRTRQVDLVKSVTQLEGEVNGWSQRKEDLLERQDSLTGKKAKNIERLTGLSDRLEASKQRQAQLLAERKEIETKLAEKQNRLGTLREKLNLQREQFETDKEQFQQVSVRLQSLGEMKKNLEGYREGVRNIILAATRENESGGCIKGVVGVVADLVNVPEPLEEAFEAVLGERLQSVVVDDMKSGMMAAGFLKDEKSGRGSFVPKIPKRAEYTQYPKNTLLSSEGPLVDMVKFKKEHEPVVKHLLDGVLVVEDLDKAVKLHKANGYRGAFVTKEGEIVDPHGVITGGSREDISSGLLQMKREIEQLSGSAGEMEEAFKKSRDVYLRNEGLIATQEASIREMSKRKDEISLDTRGIEAEIQRTANEITVMNENQDEIDLQMEAIAKLMFQGQTDIESKTTRLSKHGGELDLVQKALVESESGTRDITGKIEALTTRVTSLSAEISTDRERGEASRQRAISARNSVVDDQEEISRMTAQIEQCKNVQAQRKEQTEQAVAKIENLVVQAEKTTGEEARAREKLEGFIQSVREKEGTVKLLRKDMDGFNQSISQMNMKAVELKLTLENLCTQIDEKYSESLGRLAEEFGQSEIDKPALKARQVELNKRIRGLGEVNVSAIEEYDETKKRYEFYIEQQDDLLKSIEHLKQAISKINKESRERFSKTFASVAAKFSEIIPMLFGGGSAQLSLTESNDILDAGVDIQIRPPGKRLQNMNLLSGGEKALASIGLIFSTFLIKPSPFCLLDEVDAPLDDANIHRFNELLDQMAGQSQVILITHNKRTMEKAEALYGVTMQEKGVSKLVSVQLSHGNEQTVSA